MHAPGMCHAYPVTIFIVRSEAVDGLRVGYDGSLWIKFPVTSFFGNPVCYCWLLSEFRLCLNSLLSLGIHFSGCVASCLVSRHVGHGKWLVRLFCCLKSSFCFQCRIHQLCVYSGIRLLENPLMGTWANFVLSSRSTDVANSAPSQHVRPKSCHSLL